MPLSAGILTTHSMAEKNRFSLPDSQVLADRNTSYEKKSTLLEMLKSQIAFMLRIYFQLTRKMTELRSERSSEPLTHYTVINLNLIILIMQNCW